MDENDDIPVPSHEEVVAASKAREKDLEALVADFVSSISNLNKCVQ